MIRHIITRCQKSGPYKNRSLAFGELQDQTYQRRCQSSTRNSHKHHQQAVHVIHTLAKPSNLTLEFANITLEISELAAQFTYLSSNRSSSHSGSF